MPWKEIRVVEERMRFIVAVQQDPRGNFTQLCKRFNISRSKGYKWLKRYERSGPGGLQDLESAPKSCPHKTPEAVLDRIVELRKEHPYEGPKKIRERLLATEPDLEVPAASTIGDWIERLGLIRPRRVRLRVPPSPLPFEPVVEPNDVWSIDFKGHFACGGQRCYPLTITDGASRYLLKCEALTEPQFEPVSLHLERAFREFGLPRRIRSDNGPPFASKALGGLSKLSVRWIELGILPERIEPGKPQQNGRHERFHRTLKERTASPPCDSIVEQQRSFDRFRRDYNEARPHEALGQTPPAKHYEPSSRPLPDRSPRIHYGDEYVVRRVSAVGLISWKGKPVLITRLLAHRPIGLRQIDDDEYEISFGPLLIGTLLRRQGIWRAQSLT